MRHYHLFLIALIATLLAGCHLKAPAPVIPPTPEPVIKPSQVNISIAVPTSLAQNAINSAVPKETGADPYNVNVNGGADNCGNGVSFGYHVTRGPINLAPAGNSVTAATELDYWAKGRARSPCIFGAGPLIDGSCGVGEALPGFSLALRASFGGVDGNWNPQISTALADLHSVRDCHVTLVNINVTGHIRDGLANVINNTLPSLNQSLGTALNLRTRASQGWTYLSSPIRLQDSFWLAIHPKAIGVFPLQADAASLHAGLRLTAQPELIFSSTPPPADTLQLPAPTAVSPTNVFSVELPVEGQYSDISAQIDKDLHLSTQGIRYPPTGSNYMTITGASLYGYGAKAVLRIDGRIAGIFGKKVTVYLAGTPAYNSATNVLSFPDMDFSVESRNLLLKAAVWLDQNNLTNDLRTRAVFDLSKPVTEAKNKVQSALNQNLGPASVSGNLNELTLLSLYSSPEKGQLRMLLEADGSVDFVLH